MHFLANGSSALRTNLAVEETASVVPAEFVYIPSKQAKNAHRGHRNNAGVTLSVRPTWLGPQPGKELMSRCKRARCVVRGEMIIREVAGSC